MPAEVQLTLSIPPQLGSATEVLAELEQRVRAVEAQMAAERQRTGQRVYGRRAVLQQSWRGHPSTREPRRNLRPRVATRNQWARLEALSRDREFIVAYTGARKAWREDPPPSSWSGSSSPRRGPTGARHRGPVQLAPTATSARSPASSMHRRTSAARTSSTAPASSTPRHGPAWATSRSSAWRLPALDAKGRAFPAG